jgi:hypothetical protein
MHMRMMLIINSHFTYNYDKANRRTPMSIKAKVMGKAKGEKCSQQRVGHQSNSRPTQHHGGKVCTVKNFSHKHGEVGDIL